MTDQGDPFHLTTTGYALSEADWLDTHFAACRPEYEAQVRAVGIQHGWRVLDAASGPGSYLPWLADLDVTPESIATVERRLAGWSLPCRVEARLGSLLALPYPDASFDAVWFANTVQYLTDDELLTALAEFRRVVRPGGLVAAKDSAGFSPIAPISPFLLARLIEVVAGADDLTGRQWRSNTCRAPVLRRRLERAGLVDVWQRRTMIERWAPFTPVERRFVRDLTAYAAAMARQYDVSAADAAEWARLSDPASPDHPANHPEGSFCEGNALAVGRVPHL